MKTIDTLVEDMYAVVNDRGGWDATITNFLSEGMADVFRVRFEEEQGDRTGLRMSAMGAPCRRQLWYRCNQYDVAEPLSPQVHLKFLYGDMLEQLVLSLAMASGHDVRGMQDTLEIVGIEGHRDAVIDGVTVDVKSASEFSFQKFAGGLRSEDDAFGYLTQLESYVKAGHRADPSISHDTGAFLVIDKVHGKLCLDVHKFERSIEEVEAEYLYVKSLMDSEQPPARGFEPEDDGYYNRKEKRFVPNGNKVLGVNCSYCGWKKTCYPNLRTFIYSNRPKFFTYVKKEPKVAEVT